MHVGDLELICVYRPNVRANRQPLDGEQTYIFRIERIVDVDSFLKGEHVR